MILKLLWTDLKSEWLSILLAAATSFAILITSIGAVMPGYTTSGAVIFGLLPFPVLLVVMGGQRVVQQRRRLLAQLPVTAIAIRISSWLSYFTIVAIACLICVAILLISPPAPGWGWAGFAGFISRTIAGFTCWVAAWRILGFCKSMRSPFNHIATVAATWFFLVLWIAVAWYLGEKVPSIDDVTAPSALGLQVTAGIALAMILLDILLDRFADSRFP